LGELTAGPIRVGIVGANRERGWAREAHVPALRALAGRLELTAVAARTRQAADAAREAFGAARAFDDSLALVRDPDIDLVAVTVKVPEHRAIVLAALDAGKHLYCEWPLGRDLAEAEEMATAVTRDSTGRSHALVGLQALSAPAVRRARQLVKDGAIGTPRVLRVFSPTAGWGRTAPPHYAYLQDKRNGATLETIAGGHTLAVMETLAGPMRELDARASILNERVAIAGSDERVTRTCADHLLVLGRHEGGCVSSLEVAGGSLGPFSLELTGSEGWLRLGGGVAGGFQAGNLFLETSGEGTVPLDPVAPELEGPPANVAESYARLADDILCGQRTVPDFNRAVALTRLLDAVALASAAGTRQHVAADPLHRWARAGQ